MMSRCGPIPADYVLTDPPQFFTTQFFTTPFCIELRLVAPPPTLSLGLAEHCEDCVLTLVVGMDFVSR